MKHIEIDVHFVLDKVLNDSLEVWHVPSSVQLVDYLTHTQFHCHHSKLSVIGLPSRLRGNIKEDAQHSQHKEKSKGIP